MSSAAQSGGRSRAQRDNIDAVVKSDIAKVSNLSLERQKEAKHQQLMQSANPSTAMEQMLFRFFTRHVSNLIAKMMPKISNGYVIKRGDKISIRLRRRREECVTRMFSKCEKVSDK